MNSLGLDDYDLFNATGSYFDPEALVVRIGAPLTRLLRGDPEMIQAAATHFPDPVELWHQYRDLAARLTREGIPLQDSPWTYISAS